MYCGHCGMVLAEKTKFCSGCGAQVALETKSITTLKNDMLGYSKRINDPSFMQYISNTNRWAAIFSSIMAVASIIGFFIAGEVGAEGLDNPQSLYIGFGIGGMFLTIAFFQIISRKISRTWDGVVVDKTIKQKMRRRDNENESDDYYTEYTVAIKENTSGKLHRITSENNETVYNYYQIGDRLRHHALLNSYEKYDKSRDNIIFCSACSTLCDISSDTCFRCKCPLLK